jgi:hypothetical protein
LSSLTSEEDFCTVIQSNGPNLQLINIYSQNCNDTSTSGYPLCRLLRKFNWEKLFLFVFKVFIWLASAINDQNDFIYRLETDTEPKNLIGVIDFCSELGGYPIYANNAYEWQLVQGTIK